MKTERSATVAKVAGIKSPRALTEEFFHAPKMQDKRDALGNLFKMVADACVQLNEIAAYGLSSRSIDEAIKRKGLGYGSLVQIRKAVELIARPIEQEHRRHLAASPFKSTELGDRIKEDAIYYATIQGVSLLENIRTRRDWISAFVAADSLLQSELKGIDALPDRHRASAPKAWAKVIGKLTWEGGYWSKCDDLAHGGRLHALIAEKSARNRQGKKERAFKERYGVDPAAFLKLSDAKKMQVRDKTKRASNEPLSAAKATRVTVQAEKILGGKTPTESELKRGLEEEIRNRLNTILRK